MRDAVVLLTGLAVAACATGCRPGDGSGAGSESTAPVAWSLDYRLEGGIAGFDVRFQVDANGQAVYQRRRPDPSRADCRLAPEVVADLAKLVREGGFLGLDARYEPEPGIVSDGFRYTLRWTDGKTRKTVVASDGVPLPDSLIALRDRIGLLQRTTLNRAAVSGGESPAATREEGERR